MTVAEGCGYNGWKKPEVHLRVVGYGVVGYGVILL
jgi:uncharacterized protein YjeT (DUF2065 family)